MGEAVIKFKKEFEGEQKKLETQKAFDTKRKKWVERVPKEGFVAQAVRSYFTNLVYAKHSDADFKNACKLASRCYEKCQKRT